MDYRDAACEPNIKNWHVIFMTGFGRKCEHKKAGRDRSLLRQSRHTDRVIQRQVLGTFRTYR